MIITCKVFEDNFTCGNQDMEININNESVFTYTFWNETRKFAAFYPDQALDLLYISLFVFAADRKVSRLTGEDNWSRNIELHIPVLNPALWEANSQLLKRMLDFLSGDEWGLHFRGRGLSSEEKYYKAKVEHSKKPVKNYDSVCMFSGGLDSFVGVIDILENSDKKTMFVSHYGGGKGAKAYQDALKEILKVGYEVKENDFYQFYAVAKDGIEDSTRTRSFMFFTHAIALASALENPHTDLIIPENGLISLNIPLTNSRLGSSSTRTTHPYYMELFQKLLKNIGLNITFINPYQFMTKGEMLLQCKNQKILKENLHNTMSCSHPDQGRRRGDSKPSHCGYCLPCVIRKAAIKKARIHDDSDYFDARFNSGDTAKTNLNSYKLGIARFDPKYAFLSIQMSGTISRNINEFADLYTRGMEELKDYLEDLDE